LQQVKSKSSTSCPPANLSSSTSATPTPTNSLLGEGVRTLGSNQSEREPVQFNSVTIANGVTTLVVRNVPARYTKEKLMQEWPADGTYDFLYLPFSLKQKRTAGFAFVNFTTHEAAVDFYSVWHGKSLRDQGTAKRLSISVAEVQGLDENLRHVAASNIGRIKNPRYLPSVFCGLDEVPLEGLLEEIHVGCMDESASRTG